jgi:glucose/mannose-6-phosphate isomerase
VALLPPGFPPRSALGYSFSALAHVAHHIGILADAGRRLEVSAEALERAATAWSADVVQSRNPAKQLAIRLSGRPILVVGNERTTAPVALRWKGQFNENSKHLAWASLLPEMSHNEVDGFMNPRAIVGRLGVVFLRDPEDHPRVALRFDWMAAYLKRRKVPVASETMEGGDSMARLLWGVALGDFVSYYLALRNGQDPSALPGVVALKKALSG